MRSSPYLAVALTVSFFIPDLARCQTVIGPIVGQAERADVSKPLRELAADTEQAKQAEQQLDKPTQAIIKVLKEKYPGGERGQVAPLADPDVAKAIPNTDFYSLRFRQWPVAFEVPKGLSAGNVCVISGDDVTIISDAQGLQQFFAKHLPPATKDEEKVQAAKVWLRLSQELHSDGFFRFQPLDDKAIKVVAGVATGVTTVDPAGGNSGEIAATLTFDAQGQLTKAVEKVSLKQGIRPICQATKLLDPDPIVRRMAERDILVMGRSALPYLLEKRTEAGPDLRDAIDAAWEKIREEGR